jgi:hypothetical protein
MYVYTKQTPLTEITDMTHFNIASHSEFSGYGNITELFKAIVVGSAVTAGSIAIAPEYIEFVRGISADSFDADECPSVLLQVVEEHVTSLSEWYRSERGEYLTEGNIDVMLSEFFGDDSSSEWLDENHTSLIGVISGFIGDSGIYLYLGV